MFCSNCGKSLKSEHTVCPYCGMSVGESRFDSNRGYTGAQPKLRPGQAVRVNNSYGNHYSTTFNVESDRAANDLPSDEDSSYRAATGAGITGYGEDDEREPLFDSEAPGELPEENEPDGEEAPRVEKRSFRARFLHRDEEEPAAKAEKADEDDFADDSDELTEEEKNAIRLNTAAVSPGKGISEDVRRFMTGLREENERRAKEQEKKAAKKKAKKQLDEARSASIASDGGKAEKKADKKKKNKKSKEDIEDFEAPLDDEELDGVYESVREGDEFESVYETVDEDAGDEDEPKEDSAPAKEKKPSRKQIRVAKEFFRRSKPEEDFDDFDPEEDEEDEEEINEYADEYDDDDIDYELRRSNRLKVMRMVLAGAAALLVVVLGIMLLRNIRSGRDNVAPVEDVTLDLWNYGVELMQYRVSDDYIEQKMKLYNASNQNASWAQFSAAFTADLDGLDSLLPDSSKRQMNDQLFVDTLKAIQSNINNCLSNDWMAKLDTTKTDSQKSSESLARWQVVRNQVQGLMNAKSRGELDAVRRGEVVSFTAASSTKDDDTKPEATAQGTVYKKLSKGSSGDEVINLQTQLINLGYLNDVADGKFGKNTQTAVQLFQQTVGLEVTGIADEETQRRLFSDDVPVYSK